MSVRVCVCVCLCLCVCVCVLCVHLSECVHILGVCIFVGAFMFVCVCMCQCVCVCAARVYSVFMNVCRRACTRAFMRARVHVYMCGYIKTCHISTIESEDEQKVMTCHVNINVY